MNFLRVIIIIMLLITKWSENNSESKKQYQLNFHFMVKSNLNNK
jgi:hypothetical protein